MTLTAGDFLGMAIVLLLIGFAAGYLFGKERGFHEGVDALQADVDMGQRAKKLEDRNGLASITNISRGKNR